jgi:Na+-translocating ferredoxin:NAD+ oxidoreductase subunit D
MNVIENNAQQLPVISASPHIHSGVSVPGIMAAVILALAPAMAAALFFFGWNALRLVVVCVSTCVIAEAAARRIMRRDAGIHDLSAVVTGILLAFNLPPNLPSWMAMAGAVFAIVIAKQLFGGLGYNPFNPALAGRVFLLISFPIQMTTWSQWQIPWPAEGVAAVTGATPLGLLKTSLATAGTMPYHFDAATAWQFFIGLRNGCIGEVSSLALLSGGLYLLWRRYIYWQVPAAFIGTVVICSGALWLADPARNMNPLFHVLSGGVVLGAFFMATDMVTSPVTKPGLLIFGAGCGVLTVLIRKWGGYPEGVSFAILLMNAVTPLINRGFQPRIFGRAAKKNTAGPS